MKRKCFSILLVFLLFFKSAFAFDIDFVDMPIKDAISTISHISHLNFVYNGDDKRITWHDTDLSDYRLLDHFESVLNTNDLMLIAKDNYYLITSTDGELLEESFFIYYPQFLSAEEITASLRDIWDSSKKIKVSGGKNFVMCYGIQQYVDNLFQSIIESDTFVQKDFSAIPLEHIPVSEFMKLLEKFIDLLPYCVPDYWHNGVIIRGDSSVRLLFNNLISLYDVPQDGNVNDVVFLNKLSADSVIPIIQSTFPFVKVSKLLDDKIVLIGKMQKIKEAKELLSKIDAVNSQVKVNCIIASLSDQSFKELGVRLGIGDDSSFVKVNDSLRTYFDPSLLLSLVSDPLDVDIAVTNSKNKGELISQPQLTVLNGQTAEILVGNNIPVIKSTNKKKEETELDSIEVERMDIGVKLVITPVIQGDFVRLKIYQEVSDYNEELKGVDIATSKKMIDTTVLVADGQTIILGGVKSAERKDEIYEVPLLSDIPILGNWLFTYKSERGVNRNLVISLRPEIVRPVI